MCRFLMLELARNSDPAAQPAVQHAFWSSTNFLPLVFENSRAVSGDFATHSEISTNVCGSICQNFAARLEICSFFRRFASYLEKHKPFEPLCDLNFVVRPPVKSSGGNGCQLLQRPSPPRGPPQQSFNGNGCQLLQRPSPPRGPPQ